MALTSQNEKRKNHLNSPNVTLEVTFLCPSEHWYFYSVYFIPGSKTHGKRIQHLLWFTFLLMSLSLLPKDQNGHFSVEYPKVSKPEGNKAHEEHDQEPYPNLKENILPAHSVYKVEQWVCGHTNTILAYHLAFLSDMALCDSTKPPFWRVAVLTQWLQSSTNGQKWTFRKHLKMTAGSKDRKTTLNGSYAPFNSYIV